MTDLQQRVSGDDLEEPLEPLPPLVDRIVREAVREHLARKRRNVDLRAHDVDKKEGDNQLGRRSSAWPEGEMMTDPGGLPLERVPEGLKVRVSPSDDRVPELERGDVGLEAQRGGDRERVSSPVGQGRVAPSVIPHSGLPLSS